MSLRQNPKQIPWFKRIRTHLRMRRYLPPARPRRLAELAGKEAEFLAGRGSRLKEGMQVVRVAIEFIRGFRTLHFVGPAVTVFGSARFGEGHPYYQLSRELGFKFGAAGFSIITGGGPGCMEAANRGAQEAGATSLGCNIRLPHEQEPNRFLDKVVSFHYFFVRKVMLVKYSYAFLIVPGGVGTMDEMMEALTLIQTGKIYDFPVILLGKDYWSGLLKWFEETVEKAGAYQRDELNSLFLTDSVDEALQRVQETTARIGVKPKSLP